MFRKFVTVAAVTAPVCFRTVPQFRSAFADESGAPITKIIVEDGGEAEDDSAWVADMEGSPLCAYFNKSPCKIQFRQWIKCADKATVALGHNLNDMSIACDDYSKALEKCVACDMDSFPELVHAVKPVAGN